MAKKAATTPSKKAPAKRKPRPKKPVPAIEQAIREADALQWTVPPAKPPEAVESPFVSAVLFAVPCLISLVIGLGAGIWSAGGIEVGPGPAPQDAVSQAFDEYEKLWRAAQVRCAEKLESGEFTKSQQVTQYRALADGEAIKATRQPLLDTEFAAFGGENWTAEKAAKHLRGYANE